MPSKEADKDISNVKTRPLIYAPIGTRPALSSGLGEY